MSTPQENDAFRASFERTYKYAMESPPLSSTVVFAYRLNALALLGLIWYSCAVVVGVSDGPPAAWTRWLSIAAVGGAVAVIALTYAVSSYYGHLPGFTEDDYRLSAAWDRPPATELATIGWHFPRPAPVAGARAAGPGATRPCDCCVLHGTRHRDGRRYAYVEDARRARALYTLAFLFTLAAYQALCVATVPKAIASKPLRDAFEGLDVRQLRRDLPRLLRVLVLGAVWRVVSGCRWRFVALVVVFAGIVVGGVAAA